MFILQLNILCQVIFKVWKNFIDYIKPNFSYLTHQWREPLFSGNIRQKFQCRLYLLKGNHYYLIYIKSILKTILKNKAFFISERSFYIQAYFEKGYPMLSCARKLRETHADSEWHPRYIDVLACLYICVSCPPKIRPEI